ncbi:MAG: hypothetical protein II135_08260 [Clostridia bacterium]|nr:hypothetical protein [Clostridia bacterium]
MKYICEFDVNSHDIDLRGNLRTSAVLRYMQEAANLQLYTTGYSYDQMRADGRIYILSRLNLSVYGAVHAHDTLIAETWLYDCHGAVFNRAHRLFCRGVLAAEAITVWALVGIEDRKIYRVTDIDTSKHTDTDTVGIDAPGRINLRDVALSLCGEREVYYADCDGNGHMNNTVYPDMLFSFAPEAGRKTGGRVVSLNVSFLSEAPLGDVLKIYTAQSDGVRYFRTVRSDGKTNVEAEMVIE